jgi:two-component system, OmpR family, phosphate regulon sensor histidine kinase PhoR
VLDKLLTYFSSPYLKEFIIIPLILFIIFFILLPSATAIILSFLTAILFLILYLLVIKDRNSEISGIARIINAIRLNIYSKPEDIQLNSDLENLENEIKLMFERTKGDIDSLKKLERMRTEFIGNVSHELRTPIFTIQGFLETLLNGAVNDPEVNYKFLEKANSHTLNLSSLVNDLINLSMIESGEMRMSFRYFNINNFMHEVVSEMSSLAEEKNLELLYADARDNLQLFGDKTRLKQVMFNLITNAIKYTDKGKVEVIVKEEPKSALIIVKDSGIGIAEPEKERIFERFYRVDKARSKSAGGTGLGLAIVKHIIEAHGSKIELNSSPDQGSEFFFKLKK